MITRYNIILLDLKKINYYINFNTLVFEFDFNITGITLDVILNVT